MRLRYHQSSDPDWYCSSIVWNQSQVFRGWVNRKTSECFISDVSGLRIFNYSAFSQENAKRTLRVALVNLGVEFNKERRIKKK